MSSETETRERPDEGSADAVAAETEPRTPQERRLDAKRKRARERDLEAQAREEIERAEETIEIKVFRYDPEVAGKEEPRFDTFHVPYTQGLTVLDALIYARDHFDSSLTFRHSCRQAICGSDAFLINGEQCLGCQTQVGNLDLPIRVEPLPYYDVMKDLVVDLDDFYEEMRSMDPYLKPDDEPPGGLQERRQSRANREKIKKSTRCIWCASCMSSCSIYGQGDNYVGPAAINVAYRFAMDDRES